MSEQHDEPKPAGDASDDPRITPIPTPAIPRTLVYEAGPVTFAGLPIKPTAAAEPPQEPLPLELEPLMAKPAAAAAAAPEDVPPIPVGPEPEPSPEPTNEAAIDHRVDVSTASPAEAEAAPLEVARTDAPPSPRLSLEEWLKRAPVEELETIGVADKLPHVNDDEAAAILSADDDESPGQPVDVMPIPGMTPITEQERVDPDAVEPVIPPETVDPAAVDLEPIEPPEPAPLADAFRIRPPETAEAATPNEPVPVVDDTAAADQSELAELAEPTEPPDAPELFAIPSEPDAAPTVEEASDARTSDAAAVEEEVSFETWQPDPVPTEPAPASPASSEPESPFAGMTASDAGTLAGASAFSETPATLADFPAPAEPPALDESPKTIVGEVAPPAAAADDAAAAAADDVAAAVPPTPVATDEAVTIDAEPTPLELAAIPPERDAQVPLAAVAAGGLVTSAAAPQTVHDQTATEVFAHAHEDVEARRGFLSYGPLTKLAGIVGLLSCVAVLAIILIACAGLTPLSSEKLLAFNGYVMWAAIGMAGLLALQVVFAMLFKAGTRAAVQTGVVTLLVGGLWVAIAMFHGHMAGFDLLKVSPWLVQIAGGGLGLALIGGFIEHRRLREETHVLAAVFANVLAGIGGLGLWAIAEGWKIFPGSGSGSGM